MGAAHVAGLRPWERWERWHPSKEQDAEDRCEKFAIVPKAFWLAAIAREWGAEHIHSHWAGTTATLAMVAGEIVRDSVELYRASLGHRGEQSFARKR